MPVSGCDELDIHAGGEVAIFRHENQFNVIKKEIGAAAGILKDTKANKTVSEKQSRQSHFE